jgi:signal transduction histidine kinase
MKSLFGLRLWLLIIAIIIVGGSTVYSLTVAWRRIEALENKLTSSHLESFRLADEVQQRLLNLNNAMLRYATVRDPTLWEQFERASAQLDNWIDAHDPEVNTNSVLNSDGERLIFKELNHAYDDYRDAAQLVHSNRPPETVTSAPFAQLAGFEAQAQRLLQLGSRLAQAHRDAEGVFLQSANKSLANLRGFLLGAVSLMLFLICVLGLGIYRDMIAPLRTKLVLSQTLLEKQEKLATLGTLAAGIAHEIRNPLTSIKARLYTLQKHLLAVPATRQDTDIISAEISRLERIVQDVLSFARPSEPERRQISANELLREVHGLMGPVLESGHVQLLLEPGPELTVDVDTGHLKQVLINLVRNAGEAIDGSGTVTLRVRAGRSHLRGREGEVAILEVEDTGRGISPQVEQRLFDPFFSTKETGTGLGLSIAARIVEKHGGALQYHTRVGHGTTFGVVLPLRSRAPSPQATAPPLAMAPP